MCSRVCSDRVARYFDLYLYFYGELSLSAASEATDIYEREFDKEFITATRPWLFSAFYTDAFKFFFII